MCLKINSKKFLSLQTENYSDAIFYFEIKSFIIIIL